MANNFEVSEKFVRKILKKDFRLSFRKAKKLHPHANSMMNLVLRQQYALKLMELLS